MNFETIKNFVVDNWQFISIVIIIICNIILFLIRRKEKRSTFDAAVETICSSIPMFIIEAENKFGSGHGSDKLELVKEHCYSLIKNELGRGLTKSEKKYFDGTIKQLVEVVLTAPQKKGVK